MEESRNAFVSLTVLRASAPEHERGALSALHEFGDLLRIDLRAVDPAQASLGEVERYVEQCARVLPAVRGFCERCAPAREYERQATADVSAALRPALAAVGRAVKGMRGGDAEPRARALVRALQAAAMELPPATERPAFAPIWALHDLRPDAPSPRAARARERAPEAADTREELTPAAAPVADAPPRARVLVPREPARELRLPPLAAPRAARWKRPVAKVVLVAAAIALAVAAYCR